MLTGKNRKDKIMDNQQVTEVELAWLAGIIDGEGCVGMYNQNKRKGYHTVSPAIEIVNTDTELIEKVLDILIRLDCKPYIRGKNHNVKRKRTWKLAYNLKLQRMGKLLILLPRVIPYMTGIKRVKAEIMFQFILSRAGKRTYYSEYELQLIDDFNSATSETACETSHLKLGKGTVQAGTKVSG